MTSKRAVSVYLAACAALGGMASHLPAGTLLAEKDEKTGEIVLANDGLRVRFHAPGPRQFKLFPKGYTGYTIELKTADGWAAMASAPYFTSFCYRSGWGRDWLAYVLPQTAAVQREDASASVVFTDTRWDMDRVRWDFTLTFTVKPDRPIIDVTYAVVPSDRRELLQMWGPRLLAGQAAFGAARDEALFPGLEYLGPHDRSSRNPAIAPDSQLQFVPTPARITIPLMVIVHENRMIGLMWDPLQKWLGEETCPAAVFASPNWIQSQENHLLGLFVPGVPKFAAENTLRAHTPAVVQAGQRVSITAQIFAAAGAHAVDAVDLYLQGRGGPPGRALDADATLGMLVRALTTSAYDEKAKGWPWGFGGNARTSPSMNVALAVLASAPLLKDRHLAARAERIARDVLAAHAERPLAVALRLGQLDAALKAERARAEARIKAQNADGSWSFVPSETAEGGLAALQAPPEPGEIAPAGHKSQGYTAGEVAPLIDHVLLTGDESAWQAALKGLADLDRYTIPTVYRQEECPPAPSLHGSYLALRSYLGAYRLTGERKYLDRAVYWARTGLPFIYLWSLPPRQVTAAQVHTEQKLNPPGDALYRDARRDVMLYGGLYGYGSSQFSHHWFGLLVQWIPLVYAQDLIVLAEYDSGFPWKKVAEGILASAAAQSFDKDPYTGLLPDAFSLDSWTPSGPAFSPAKLLDAVLRHHDGWSPLPRTVIVRHGGLRCHLTSSSRPGDVKLDGRTLTFSLSDPLWTHVRVIVAGIGDHPAMWVDGREWPRADDLESQDECWAPTSDGLSLLKVRTKPTARHVEIRLAPAP